MTDMLSLVEPLIPGLRRYAFSLLTNQADADDLVQDCLEKAITRWHQRRPDGDTRAWLYSILHNLAVSQMRRRARRGGSVPVEDVPEANLAVPASQDSTLLRRDLVAALDALPEEQRTVLLLVSVEDVSYAEAAQMLDVPIGTVMSRLSRARDRMNTMLEKGTASAAAPRTLLRRIK